MNSPDTALAWSARVSRCLLQSYRKISTLQTPTMRGANHDRSSALLTPIISIALTPYLPVPLIYAAVIGFVLGFSHLSPDVDLPQSLPSRRWGFLHPMWRWYRMNHKHRGRSHFPLWGTFERLLYLSLFVAPVAIFVGLQAPDDVAKHSEGMAN